MLYWFVCFAFQIPCLSSLPWTQFSNIQQKKTTTKFHYNLIFNLHFKCHLCVKLTNEIKTKEKLSKISLYINAYGWYFEQIFWGKRVKRFRLCDAVCRFCGFVKKCFQMGGFLRWTTILCIWLLAALSTDFKIINVRTIYEVKNLQ